MPKTTRELIWVPTGESIQGSPIKKCGPIKLTSDKKVLRLWTIYSFCSKEIPPPKQMPLEHGKGAYLEEQMHDWNVENNTLRYRSRFSDGGNWVILELEDN